MPKSQKEMNEFLLNAIFRDVQMCKMAINNVIDKVKDSKLRRELKRQFKDYDNFSESCEDLANALGVEVADNNILVRARMWLGANFATMLDKSNRKIAGLNILRSTASVIGLMSALSDSKKCKSEIVALGNTVKKTQEESIEKLKPYILAENNKSDEDVAIKKSKPTKKETTENKN
jgi:hypothetical protein